MKTSGFSGCRGARLWRSDKGFGGVMKKFLLALLLAAITTGAMARWVQVSEADYYDPASISKIGSVARMTVLLQPPDQGSSVRSVELVKEFDCKKPRTSRAVSSTLYLGPMGTDRAGVIEEKPGDWIHRLTRACGPLHAARQPPAAHRSMCQVGKPRQQARTGKTAPAVEAEPSGL